MATGGSSSDQDSLSCGVCFESFDTTTHLPKALPCLHTFCCSCIQSLIDVAHRTFEDTFKCPECRNKVAPSDVRTNLTVRNIVEELMDKQSSKMFCSDHSGKECHMICTDCCKPVCSACIKGLMKGPHRDHNIEDIEDVKAEMKERINAVLKDKIASLEKKTISEVNKLERQSQKYEMDVNTVVYMVTEAVHAWKAEQLQKERQGAQAAIDKQKALCESQKEAWTRKLNLTSSKDLVEAIREIEKVSKSTTAPPDVELPLMDLSNLQDKLISLCTTIRTMTKDNNLPSPSGNSTSAAQEKAEEAIHWDFIVHLCNCAIANKGNDKKQQNTNTNTYLPKCVKHVANLYNPKRNKKFSRVASCMWQGDNILFCRTDDFIFRCNYNLKSTSVLGMWLPNAHNLIKEFEEVDNVLNDPEYSEIINKALQVWETGLCSLKTGTVEIKWEAHDDTN